MRSRLWITALIVLVTIASAQAKDRTWTFADGSSIVAEFVREVDGEVTFIQGTKIVTISLDKLSEQDQKVVKALGDGKDVPENEPAAGANPQPKGSGASSADAPVGAEQESAPRRNGDQPRKKIAIETRTWTDILGNKTQAKFTRVNGNDVVLTRGTKIVTIPFHRLTDEDQEYVRELLTSQGKEDQIPSAAPPVANNSNNGAGVANAPGGQAPGINPGGLPGGIPGGAGLPPGIRPPTGGPGGGIPGGGFPGGVPGGAVPGGGIPGGIPGAGIPGGGLPSGISPPGGLPRGPAGAGGFPGSGGPGGRLPGGGLPGGGPVGGVPGAGMPGGIPGAGMPGGVAGGGFPGAGAPGGAIPGGMPGEAMPGGFPGGAPGSVPGMPSGAGFPGGNGAGGGMPSGAMPGGIPEQRGTDYGRTPSGRGSMFGHDSDPGFPSASIPSGMPSFSTEGEYQCSGCKRRISQAESSRSTCPHCGTIWFTKAAGAGQASGFSGSSEISDEISKKASRAVVVFVVVLVIGGLLALGVVGLIIFMIVKCLSAGDSGGQQVRPAQQYY